MKGGKEKKRFSVKRFIFNTTPQGTLLLHHLAVCFPGEGEGFSG